MGPDCRIGWGMGMALGRLIHKIFTIRRVDVVG